MTQRILCKTHSIFSGFSYLTDTTNLSFRVAMREHGKLRFNPVPYLLALAFADGAFFGLDSPEALERWDPDDNEPTRLLWKPHMVNQPILRMVTRSSGVSERPLVRATFCRLFRGIVCNAGYYEIITVHSLRRGLANRIDSKSLASADPREWV